MIEVGGHSSKIARGWKLWLRNEQNQGSLSFLICVVGIITGCLIEVWWGSSGLLRIPDRGKHHVGRSYSITITLTYILLLAYS